jgi:outer membrane protein assembly factor BamB
VLGALALGLAASLAGCGGGDEASPGESSTTGGATGRGRVWRFNTITKEVEGVPFGGGSPVKTPPVDAVRALAVDDGKLWVQTSDTAVAAFSTADGRQVAARPDVGVALGAIVARAGQVWAFDHGRTPQRHRIVRLDPTSGATLATVEVGEVNEKPDVLVPTPDALYVLLDNGFALVRVDARSNTVAGRVNLGEDPRMPDGPRGAFYGYGELAVLGSTAWVLDRYKYKLIEIALPDLTVRAVTSVRALVDADNALQMKGDGNALYVHSPKARAILALDPRSPAMPARTFRPSMRAGASSDARVDRWDVAGGRVAVGLGFGEVVLLRADTFAEQGVARTLGPGPFALE